MPHYQVHTNVASHFVGTDNRLLGAYGTNFWRSWIYPFYTPSGRTVVENFPFDHPFHNGIFVGQNPVKVGEREANFWAFPVKRGHDDHIMKKMGRMDPQGEPTAEVTDDGVRFALQSIWRDEQEAPLIDEQRTVLLRALPDATLCDMTSRKTAAYGAAEFARTKFGSLGARVEPRLLPALGGQVIGCIDGELRRGTADEVANQKACDAVAYENDVPVYPRGAASGLSGGSVPVKGGIALVITRMDKILELNTDDLYAKVEAGVIVADLINEAAKHGLVYPPDPSSMKTCTMAGAVAENAGGLRGLKYGVTSDYVIGLTAVAPDGTIFKTGAITVKSVSGYNLTQLLVGSEGTLAVITDITVKLTPVPKARKSLMALFNDIADAGNTVAAVIKSGTIPATLEIMDKMTLNAVEDFKGIGLPRDADALLLFETDGAPEPTEQEAQIIEQICREHNATEIRVAASDAERDAIWEARRAALPSLARVKPTCILEDATVPRSKVPDMIQAVVDIAKKYDVLIGTFGHAGDGNLHPTVVCDERDAEEMERVEKAIDEIFEAAIKLDGTLSGEHGIGLAKKKYLKMEFGDAGVAMMQAVKQAFDPKNILNPGKIFEQACACGHGSAHPEKGSSNE